MIEKTIKFQVTKLTERNSTRTIPDSKPPKSERIDVVEIVLAPIPGEKLRDPAGAEQAVTHVPTGQIKVKGLAAVDGFELVLNQQFDVTFKEIAAD